MEWFIDISPVDGTVTVKLKGECDLYSAPAFAKAMLSLLAGGGKAFRFDLTDLAYLDSSGVGAIIRILQAARAGSVALAFRGIRGSPRKVLRMANILTLLAEEDIREETAPCAP